jgi:hypothetical protein
LQFDGTGDYVSVAHEDSLNISNVTVSAWIKTSTTNGIIAIKRAGSGSYPYCLWVVDTGKARFESYGGANPYTNSTTSVNDGNWHHVVGVRDTGSTTLKIYVDGKQENTTTDTAGTGTNTGNLLIGQTNNGQYFNGLIDDVRIYNYARDANQIMQDYTQGAARLGAQAAGVADPWGGALPVAHWKLDENTGVLAYDASGNGNNGTLVGNPTWVQGKNGPCLNFDGSGDYVNCGTNSSLDITGAVTIEGWFKSSVTPASGDYGLLFGNTEDGASTQHAYAIHKVSNTERVLFAISDGTNVAQPQSTTGVNMWDNQWHHVAGVFDPTLAAADRAKIYVDGKFNNFATYNGTTLRTVTTKPFRIGSGNTYDFTGLIDDVRIYNYARTQAQIAWDYNRGKPVGSWRMDEKAAGQAVDTSAGYIKDDSDNNNDGTASATTWAAYATGKFGSALSFDGNDYVTVSNSSSLKFGTGDFALSLWVKVTAAAANYPLDIDTGGRYVIVVNADGSITWEIDDDAAHAINSGGLGSGFNDGNWHNIVVVFNRGGNAITYKDGVQIDSRSIATVTGNVSPTGNLIIGARYSIDQGYFHGLIDDVRIYNYARTADQILQDYNAGAAARLGD